jgi:hypothetical protein
MYWKYDEKDEYRPLRKDEVEDVAIHLTSGGDFTHLVNNHCAVQLLPSINGIKLIVHTYKPCCHRRDLAE